MKNTFQQTALSYNLPDSVQYDPSIPVPETVLGHTCTHMLVHVLREHRIEVHTLKTAWHSDGLDFFPGSTWVVQALQPQYVSSHDTRPTHTHRRGGLFFGDRMPPTSGDISTAR